MNKFKISTKFIDAIWESDSTIEFKFLVTYDITLTHLMNLNNFFTQKGIDITLVGDRFIQEYDKNKQLIPKLIIVPLKTEEVRKIKIWGLLKDE
jgi:hypothetical protein